MNLETGQFYTDHILHLVCSVTRRSLESTLSECTALCSGIGLEAERELVRAAFAPVDFSKEPNKAQHNTHLQFLAEVLDLFWSHPNLPSLLGHAVDSAPSRQQSLKKGNPYLFEFLHRHLRLKPFRELVVVQALTHSKTLGPEASARVQQLLATQSDFWSLINEAPDKASFFDVPSHPEALHSLLSSLRDSTNCEKEAKALEEAIKRHISPSQTCDLLLLEEDSGLIMSTGNSSSATGALGTGSSGGLGLADVDQVLPEIIKEIGYEFTSKAEMCKQHLSRLMSLVSNNGNAGSNSGGELHASLVARIIGVMVRTHTGLDDSATLQKMNATGTSLWEKDKNSEPKTWSVEIFITTVHDLQPTLNWKEIIYELDHPGFNVKDRQGLIMLVKALKLGLSAQGFQGGFPIDLFYREWHNSDSQVSLFQQILRNSDVFSFADHVHTSVAVEVMKVPPDLENRDIAAWKSLELLDTLLLLAESGHAVAIMEMFQVPKTHCPDVLTLGLIQIKPPLTAFRTDALAQLFQIFLNGHPNASVILSYGWHSSSLALKPVVAHSMAEWYSKAGQEGDADHTRLARILDVAQDLKALSVLLNAKAVPFVIDLAVVASKREYLNLDKWLSDQMRDHGDAFAKEVVRYLRRKLPPLAANTKQQEDGSAFGHTTAKANANNFPLDTLPTLLLSLQQYATQNPLMQMELKEAIVAMMNIAQPVLNRGRLVPPTNQPPPPPPTATATLGMMRPPNSAGSANPAVAAAAAVAAASYPIRPTPTRPGSTGSQMPLFGPPTHHPHDPLLSLANQFGAFGLGNTAQAASAAGRPPLPPTSASALGLPSALGPLVSAAAAAAAGPASPPNGAAVAAAAHHRLFGNTAQLPPPPQGAPQLNTSLDALITTTSSASGSLSESVSNANTSGVGGSSGGSMQTGIEQIRQGNITQMFPDSSGPVAKEVEDEANSYFQRIYNLPPHPTLTTDEVLELLKKFQESSISREREVFHCMIKNLFEEYKFFPEYPEKELQITARLFGGIIEHGLVTMVPLGLALRCVLDCLRKPMDNNMFSFGITAVDRFKARLKDYPKYCQHIACIDHFKNFPKHIVEWVEKGVEGLTPPNKPQGPVHFESSLKDQSASASTPVSSEISTVVASNVTSMGSLVGSNVSASSTSKTPTPTATSSASSSNAIVRPTSSSASYLGIGRPSIANTTNIDTLLNARQKESEATQTPGEKTQEKVAFIFNNLSLLNMQQKANDLRDILGKFDDYTGWLAQYLVMKRASIEPNFHSLYASFLEVLRHHQLYSDVLSETYGNIRILLGSDKCIANFSDRSLLKNLGHWLGLMTLARNKPILMLDLDLKPLVIEAYHNGQQELLYVVPFVAKIMESCAKSRVFKPPCPWTVGIMNLLAELHQEHDLKLNLKFEVEVLCKTLNIELAQLTPGNLLKDYDKLNRMLSLSNFGMKTNNSNASVMAGTGAGTTTGSQHALLHPLSTSTPHRDVYGRTTNPAAAAAAAAALGLDYGLPPSLPPPPRQGFGLPPSSVPTSVPPPVAVVPAGAPAMALMGNGQLGQMNAPPPLPPAPAAAFGPDASALMSLVSANKSATSSNRGTPTFASGGNQTPVPPPGITSSSNAYKFAEPKFHYSEISTANLNAIVPHISINNEVPMLKQNPDLVQLIKLALEKSIQEWLSPVVERAVKIAVTTCEQLVKKDFSLEPDESRMRIAAHNTVRNLTAGMAMITCREHLRLSTQTHFKNCLLSLGRNIAAQHREEEIEKTAAAVASDNLELACTFIQKKAIEKALPEIDKRLQKDYEQRIAASKEGRRHCDPMSLAYQNERMPELLRVQSGNITAAQSAVYDEFARNIPGFKTLTDDEMVALAPKQTLMSNSNTTSSINVASVVSDECVAIIDEVFAKVDHFTQHCTVLPNNPHLSNLRALLDAMKAARSTRETSAVVSLIVRAVDNLLAGLTALPNSNVDSTEALARYRDANLLILRALADTRAYGAAWTKTRVTGALMEAREEIRFNMDAFDCLIRSELVNLADYDKFLAGVIGGQNSNGAEPSTPNQHAINFAMLLVKIYLIDERANSVVIENDLSSILDVLQKLSTQTHAQPEGITQLMEMVRLSGERLEQQNLAMAGPTAQLYSGIQQARQFEDPPGLLEKTEYLLREWVQAYHSREAGKDSRQAFVVFVQLMNQQGILKTDDLITRFFRMSTQMCVDLCYRALAEQNNAPTLVRAKCFHTLDAYVRLITLLVKHSGEMANTVTKVNLLNKILGIVAGVLEVDHNVRGTEFQQVPYHRIFIMLFLELNSPDPILESIHFQVLTAFCNMLHFLRPSKAPGFAYAWLEIISHRIFLGRILAGSGQLSSSSQSSLPQSQKGWPMFSQLLVDLFKFLSPFLRNAELAKPVQRLYRGTLRVLLVLLHDFPEFLCDYHYSFCDVIPPNCIQMRNLILSAFPHNMRLPDPFTPNLKVEMLPEISMAPRILSNYASTLSQGFKNELDSYLKNRSPVAFLSQVRDHLLLANHEREPGNRYNIQLINALVMYVGTAAIQHVRSKGQTPNMTTIAHSSHMDIFQNLAVDLETEGRYLFLNCIANQLRYPNSHTHYFSCTLLYLFAEANTEAIQEQITRVLLERLIVNRPHPWGLLITFIELIKNPTFNFWQHEFVTCAPEIQKLFESVARSCMVTAGSQQSRKTEGTPFE